ncbi:MAG TPA: HEAT repeat domain-containing protein, partial [Methanoculleus sp.]|nr:HEAT repeat domain-containing protein [Methanoculleus sp.]
MAFFDRFRANVERLQQERDYAGLARALSAEDPSTRADAARALAALGVPAIPALLDALESARPASRNRMTESLVSTGIPSIPLLLAVILRASPALQASISRAVAGAGDGMFEALLPALHHEQPAIRRAAVITLRDTGKKAVPHFAKMLHGKDPSVGKEAANALAALHWAPDDPGEKAWFCYLREDWKELAKLQGAAVPILLKALCSNRARERCDAARTLGKIRDGRTIPALIGAMKDPDIDLRIHAAEALGEMGDDRAKPALANALNDPHHRVRMEAAWALNRLGWVPPNDLARAEHLVAGEQWNELVRMGRPAIPALIRALEVEYSGVRTGASEALRQLGQPALTALKTEIVSKNPARQQRARMALEYIRRRQEEASRTGPAPADSSRYEQELKEGLAIQRRFVKQFGRERPLPSVPVKKPQPKEEEAPAPPVPESTPVQASEEPKKPVVLEDLIMESQQAEEAWARVKAQFKQEVSVPAGAIPLEQLIPLEFEEAIAGSDSAGETNEEPARKEPGPRELDIPDIPQKAPKPDIDEPVPEKTPLEQYLEALKSSDESIRATAIAALQAMGKEAIVYLIAALKDPHYSVRIAAVEALGELKDDAAVDALILVCADIREDVRIAVARALGSIGDRRAIRPLIRLFGDRYHGVRVAAADAVAVFGRDALGPLEDALDDPAPPVRVTAAKAIGLIGAGESVPALIEHLGDAAPEVRWSVARALAGFGPLAVEPLFLVLRKGKKEMRLAA